MSENESKNTFPKKFFEWMNDVTLRINQTEKEIQSIKEHLKIGKKTKLESKDSL